MLNVKIKHLTFLKLKNWKKDGNFHQGCKKNRAQRFSLILTKIGFLSNASDLEALTLILIELWLFSPHNL